MIYNIYVVYTMSTFTVTHEETRYNRPYLDNFCAIVGQPPYAI